MNGLVRLIVAGAVTLCPSAVSAYDWVSIVNVDAVEATYAPSTIRFWINGTAGTCPGGQDFGSQLDFKPSGSTPEERIANGQTVAAILMTAKASGRKIKVFGRNSDCVVEYIYLL